MVNEVLVQHRVGSSAQARGAVRALAGGVSSEVVLAAADRRDGKGELEVVRLAPGRAVADAIRNLANHPDVETVEPNWVYRHLAVSNDAQFGSLWGMQGTLLSPSNSYGSGAATAWYNGNTGSSSIVVAVLDEGVMNTHEDLSANIWRNAGEIGKIARKDDDATGYADDFYGWDFYQGNNSTYDGTSDDHGTHVAGTIGAKGGNGLGVAGVCWDVQIISTKFLGPNGGSTANAIKAIDYIIKLKTLKNLNLVAINNSWGGGGFSQTLSDAIGRANTANILFVAAAGNSTANNDTSAFYPANYVQPNIIAVAAINSSGGLAYFSNYGATKVHLGAPGENITSTLPASSGSTYGSYSGTSMATPHVTGACALYAAAYLAKYGTVPSAAQIKAAILNSAVPLSSLTGKTITGGRLDVSTFYVGSGAAGL